MHFDNIDLKILAALQENGALANAGLAELTGLSEEDVSKRRAKLEDDSIISGYNAFISRAKTGFDIFAFVQIILTDHERSAAEKFGQFLKNSPFVLEAHAMTEDMDFLAKVVVSSLEELSMVISDHLEAQEGVKSARALISLETIKETTALPF
ncbi:MAG: Lrp/AsnC family transcriptional regulator [Rhizobiaceae bacterium]|nr:Lrp/AsnC family transcriptional regulator [Rhizobiaceae bacterium]